MALQENGKLPTTGVGEAATGLIVAAGAAEVIFEPISFGSLLTPIIDVAILAGIAGLAWFARRLHNRRVPNQNQSLK